MENETPEVNVADVPTSTEVETTEPESPVIEGEATPDIQTDEEVAQPAPEVVE